MALLVLEAALMHAFTTRSNTLRKMSLSRNRSLRARENAE
jgi:cytochrome b561